MKANTIFFQLVLVLLLFDCLDILFYLFLYIQYKNPIR